MNPVDDAGDAVRLCAVASEAISRNLVEPVIGADKKSIHTTIKRPTITHNEYETPVVFGYVNDSFAGLAKPYERRSCEFSDGN